MDEFGILSGSAQIVRAMCAMKAIQCMILTDLTLIFFGYIDYWSRTSIRLPCPSQVTPRSRNDASK